MPLVEILIVCFISTENSCEAVDGHSLDTTAPVATKAGSEYDKYAFIPEIEKKFRNYQQELALPGLSGQNYIICAPTGSGKTMVAGCIIASHLQQQRKELILFMVDKVHLATQQKDALKKYVYGAKIKAITGQDGATSRFGKLSPAIADVFVCTAGYIEHRMKEENAQLDIVDFSLIIIDECHHALKQHPYARIMQYYLSKKMTLSMEASSTSHLPQIVGLTASPGAGGGVKVEAVRENLLDLCAQMDAIGGIHTVKRHKEELDHHTNQPLHEIVLCNGRDESEHFIVAITEVMRCIEQEILNRDDLPCTKWTQMYISQIQSNVEEMSQDQANALTILLALAKGLNAYMDLEKDDAIKFLEDTSLPQGETLTNVQQVLQTKYRSLLENLRSIESVTNPLLLKLAEIIVQKMQYGESKAIIIVQTIQQARSICKWIEQHRDLKDKIIPRVVVGQKKVEGMTKAVQNSNVTSLRRGETNLLVTTSILEEGMDIPKCNLVIRYQHVSNEIARMQVEGRARAANSEVFTIISSEKKRDQEDINKEKARLVNEAVSCIPAGQLLIRELDQRQKDMLCKEELKHKKDATRKSQHSGSDVELMCKGCLQVICNGSDLCMYLNHTVVIDPTFNTRVKAVEKKEHKRDADLTRTHDITCISCGYDLGVKGKASESDQIYYVLKCCQVMFKVNGQKKHLKHGRRYLLKLKVSNGLPLQHS